MSQPQKEPTTPAQIHVAWCEERIQEEIRRAQQSQTLAARRLNRLTAAGKVQSRKAIARATDLITRRRGEVIAYHKALALVQQVAKAVR